MTLVLGSVMSWHVREGAIVGGCARWMPRTRPETEASSNQDDHPRRKRYPGEVATATSSSFVRIKTIRASAFRGAIFIRPIHGSLIRCPETLADV